MDAGRIIIFTAVPMETRAVQRALAGMNGMQVYPIGIRAKRMPSEPLAKNATALVMAGLAGALDPSLKVGDVIVEDRDNLLPTDVPFRRGMIHCAEWIITTPEQKAELFARTGAAAVDMESQIVRNYAEQMGLPFISVRAISDTAAETLDPAVMGLVDEMGRIKPLALATTLLRRPGLIPYLNRLGNNSQLAANQLGLAVRAIVDSI
jgi:hypothetical protein